MIALAIAGIAVATRNIFAYISAFVGTAEQCNYDNHRPTLCRIVFVNPEKNLVKRTINFVVVFRCARQQSSRLRPALCLPFEAAFPHTPNVGRREGRHRHHSGRRHDGLWGLRRCAGSGSDTVITELGLGSGYMSWSVVRRRSKLNKWKTNVIGSDGTNQGTGPSLDPPLKLRFYCGSKPRNNQTSQRYRSVVFNAFRFRANCRCFQAVGCLPKHGDMLPKHVILVRKLFVTEKNSFASQMWLHAWNGGFLLFLRETYFFFVEIWQNTCHGESVLSSIWCAKFTEH